MGRAVWVVIVGLVGIAGAGVLAGRTEPPAAPVDEIATGRPLRCPSPAGEARPFDPRPAREDRGARVERLTAAVEDARAREEPSGEVATEVPPAVVALHEVAEAHLRRHWEERYDEIVASLGEVGSTPWVEQQVEEKVSAHVSRLGLSARDAERLRDGYTSVWTAHAAELSSLVHDEDWEGLLDEARELWDGEDAMLEATLGPDAARGYETDELRSRTTILAIVAALGGLPWDEQVLAP